MTTAEERAAWAEDIGNGHYTVEVASTDMRRLLTQVDTLTAERDRMRAALAELRDELVTQRATLLAALEKRES